MAKSSKKGKRTNFYAEVYAMPAYQEMLVDIGCQYKARGILMVAWELAQEHWLEHKGVPKAKWPPALDVLLRHGFARAETRGDDEFIYVCGSAEHCKFLEKQSKNGKKGGQSKSPKKLANLRQFAENPEAKPKPNRSQEKPTEVSFSYSLSDSGIIPFPSETGAAPPAPAAQDLPVKAGKNGVALWLEAYHRKYGVRCELTKRDQKTLVDFRNQRTEEHTATLFAAYCAMDGPRGLYAQAKHPLSLFFRDLQSISVAAQTGVDHSKPELVSPEDLK